VQFNGQQHPEPPKPGHILYRQFKGKVEPTADQPFDRQEGWCGFAGCFLLDRGMHFPLSLIISSELHQQPVRILDFCCSCSSFPVVGLFALPIFIHVGSAVILLKVQGE